jgi:hypothetical protein
MMNDELDTLLKTSLLSVPDDFTERVMREIKRLPLAEHPKTWNQRLQWLAIIGAALLGVFELVTFIFGIWTVTTAY